MKYTITHVSNVFKNWSLKSGKLISMGIILQTESIDNLNIHLQIQYNQYAFIGIRN